MTVVAYVESPRAVAELETRAVVTGTVVMVGDGVVSMQPARSGADVATRSLEMVRALALTDPWVPEEALDLALVGLRTTETARSLSARARKIPYHEFLLAVLGNARASAAAATSVQDQAMRAAGTAAGMVLASRDLARTTAVLEGVERLVAEMRGWGDGTRTLTYEEVFAEGHNVVVHASSPAVDALNLYGLCRFSNARVLVERGLENPALDLLPEGAVEVLDTEQLLAAIA